MVSRKTALIWIFISAQAAHAAHPSSGLTLRWTGPRTEECRRLVGDFLAELRSMAADRTIELEAMGPAEHASPPRLSGFQHLTLRCPDGARPDHVVVAGEDGERLTLSYLPKASGFAATDWVPFQEKYLRPDLAHELSSAPSLASTASPQLPPPPSYSRESGPGLLQKWWFWTLVGGVGAGAYALTRVGQPGPGINVEIH